MVNHNHNLIQTSYWYYQLIWQPQETLEILTLTQIYIHLFIFYAVIF